MRNILYLTELDDFLDPRLASDQLPLLANFDDLCP